ncbi:zinc finger cdgsh-type domain protein [Ichthyophthirius multifiliis]|uniref:Zinc finger cdgsh-type domain protein n=1 Tax=Ichthyophthirius multifiliis TaxID=5932 RepID=G0QYS5_ICHMU|nr:zinc finger cdgsh-type domain protein [Ichthyophthirius multifiliis]EGR29636.1 zinc finger cdgsh-type domain protein [Ichthyophthirius multifiliis]|eukprot:XP_004030872.1 zinc finger cdgsh-type domain protein [Ichthyophthirius multifiliis]
MIKRNFKQIQTNFIKNLKFTYKKLKEVPKEEFIVTQTSTKPTQITDVKNPKVGEKKYKWCSCGLSLSQVIISIPFCDGSHKGTAFIPFRFTIEEAVNQIQLCGCKFTKNAPFCDRETCQCLVSSNKTIDNNTDKNIQN